MANAYMAKNMQVVMANSRLALLRGSLRPRPTPPADKMFVLDILSILPYEDVIN
jgi:hypothetical protein